MKSIVKVSSKGQTVLPAAVRQKADTGRGDALAAHVASGKVVLEPLKKGGSRGLAGNTPGYGGHLAGR